jgi:hypothetical protein
MERTELIWLEQWLILVGGTILQFMALPVVLLQLLHF